jgi:hypothetical protein
MLHITPPLTHTQQRPHHNTTKINKWNSQHKEKTEDKQRNDNKKNKKYHKGNNRRVMNTINNTYVSPHFDQYSTF